MGKSKKRILMRKRSRPKESKHVRKNRAILKSQPEENAKAPHSFVIQRGPITGSLKTLLMDFRKVMEPFTASALRANSRKSIKDFVNVAGPLHVSHLCGFSATSKNQFLKVCRLPQGPTLSFSIKNYCTSTDVASLQRKQHVYWKQFMYAPLVVMNGFNQQGEQFKLMSTMFQNLFPTLNLSTVNLSSVRRCLLLNYNPETHLIDFRHYAIKIAPTGIAKGIKKLLKNKVPDFSKFDDISEVITKSGVLSDSEVEDDPNSHVVVPQTLAFRGSQLSEKSAVRLHELGPRMTLQLLKVQAGIMEGEVLFHDEIKKTDEEIEATRKRREARRRLREKRKREQEMNKRRKEKEQAEKKTTDKSLEGVDQRREKLLEDMKMRRPLKKGSKEEEEKRKKIPQGEVQMRKAILESQEAAPVSDDDDAEWYTKEVGEEPEKDMFRGKRTSLGPWVNPWKKPKLDKHHGGQHDKGRAPKRKKPVVYTRSGKNKEILERQKEKNKKKDKWKRVTNVLHAASHK